MSHKPFHGLKFQNTVPKFLQSAIAEHRVKQNSFLAKNYETENGTNNDDESKETAENRFDYNLVQGYACLLSMIQSKFR